MQVQMFSIYDVKTAVYHMPIFGHNQGHIMRTVSDQLENPQIPYSKHPEDYLLFSVGEFDDNTGELVATKPKQICCLSDLVTKE